MSDGGLDDHGMPMVERTMRGIDGAAAAGVTVQGTAHEPERAALPVPVPGEAPLVLDFDETYWLRNSTEAFLDSIRPAWPAACILKLADALRPWRLLPGPDKDHVWRDWLRVVLLNLLFPWSLARWRKHAAVLGPRWLNPQLAALVERVTPGRCWIVTNGFRPIVGPLVAALPAAARPTLLASPLLTGFAWRRRGKRQIAEAALGADTLARATVVTDNDEDGDLLAAAGQPVHRKWPEARYEPAHRDAYLPFYYMERIKRPGQRHLLDVVLKDELVLLLLVYLWASPSLAVLAALLALQASFWVIYEILYVENDRVAERLEADPTLSSAYHTTPHRFSEPLAWLVGLSLGAIGVGLLQLAALPGIPGFFGGLALWAGLLGSLRGLAYLYNHVDKATRVPLYLPLQALKPLGAALLLPLPMAATPLVTAHIAALWLPYIAYRRPGASKSAWRAPNHLYRLALAVVFVAGYALVLRPSGLDPAALLLPAIGLAWFAFKARHDLQALLRNARWLRRDA